MLVCYIEQDLRKHSNAIGVTGLLYGYNRKLRHIQLKWQICKMQFMDKCLTKISKLIENEPKFRDIHSKVMHD